MTIIVAHIKNNAAQSKTIDVFNGRLSDPYVQVSYMDDKNNPVVLDEFNKSLNGVQRVIRTLFKCDGDPRQSIPRIHTVNLQMLVFDPDGTGVTLPISMDYSKEICCSEQEYYYDHLVWLRLTVDPGSDFKVLLHMHPKR